MLSIESGVLVQVLIGFGVILILIFLLTWIMKKLNLVSARIARQGEDPRLSIKEVIAVDHKRRLLLVRRDSVEHLLLIGGETDLLVEHGIPSQHTQASHPQMETTQAASVAHTHHQQASAPTPRMQAQHPTAPVQQPSQPASGGPSAPQMQRPQEPMQRPAPQAQTPTARTSSPGMAPPIHPAERNIFQARDQQPRVPRAQPEQGTMPAPQGLRPEQSRQEPMRDARPTATRPEHPLTPPSRGQHAPATERNETANPISGPTADRVARARPGQRIDPVMRAPSVQDEENMPSVSATADETASTSPFNAERKDASSQEQAKQKPAAPDQDESTKPERSAPKHPAEEKLSEANRDSLEKQAPTAKEVPPAEAESKTEETSKAPPQPPRTPDQASEQTPDQKPEVQAQRPRPRPQPQVPQPPQHLAQPAQTPEETGADHGPASPERPQRPRPTAQPPQAPSDSPAPGQGQSSPSQADAHPKTGEPSSDETDQQPQMEPLSKSASYDDEINRLLNELSSEIKK